MDGWVVAGWGWMLHGQKWMDPGQDHTWLDLTKQMAKGPSGRWAGWSFGQGEPHVVWEMLKLGLFSGSASLSCVT